MSDPRSRAKSLIAEARHTAQLRDRLKRDGQDTGEIDELLATLHRDLGALLVTEPELAALLHPMIPDPQPQQESFTDELPVRKDHGWYDDEKTGPIEGGPLFDQSDLVTGEVPVPDDLHLPPESDDTDADEQYAVETTASMAVRAAEPTTGLGRYRAGNAPYQAALREFLELLRSPYDLDDPTELGVEASRVQWATTELENRVRDFPNDVKLTIIGLLAARAQYLRTRLDVDVGARRSLDRLQRYRIERDLPAVTGLLPTPVPESSSWLEDAERWWAVFHPTDAP